MYNPKTVEFALIIDNEIFKFELDLRGSVTVIEGNSGTGKTLLARAVYTNQENYAKKHGGYAEVVDYRNYYALDKVLKSYNGSNNLLIVDNADDFITREQVEYMDADRHNHYILMLRDSKICPVSPNYFAELYTDNHRVYKLKYAYDNPRWY